MPHHRRRDSVQIQQLLQRAHLNATQAHVKLELKDSRITLLESDKIAKDAKLLELETDKTSKDTAMADLTARLATLENGNGGGGGGDSMTSEAVSWTNLSEINLSGEKLTNGNFSSVTNNAPTNWSVYSGTLDQTKLASGIVDGTGGAVAIQQLFSSGIASGTTLVCKATRNDINTGSVYIQALRANGTPWSGNFHIQPSDGYVEFTTTEIMYGLRLTTSHGTREVSSISLFQGKVSGGTVQAYAGGTIEKISGSAGYTAGASSVQVIEGNSDGYVQFQLAFNDKTLKVGLVNIDQDFSVDTPWVMNFGGGHVDFFEPYISNHTAVSTGDWFRIRHYSTDNEIHFQKKQKIYEEDAHFCLLQTCGLMPNNGHSTDHTFTTAGRPLIKAKKTINGLTEGEYYQVYAVNTTTLHVNVYTTTGVWVGWMQDRATHWEVQKEIGEDYVTFYTHPTLTNGEDLYVDVSFFSLTARLNDVTIVR
jgi:hypothetical protein